MILFGSMSRSLGSCDLVVYLAYRMYSAFPRLEGKYLWVYVWFGRGHAMFASYKNHRFRK